MAPLKATLKRGALLAAANWQVALIQAVADSLFKLLIAVPAIGGAFFVALVIGADPEGILALEWREMVTTVVAALLSQPLVLTAFLSSLGVAVIGGSLFMFLIKGGTVATLVAGDRRSAVIEQAFLRASFMVNASGFSTEGFMASCERLFPRYAGLGFMLMGVYLLSGSALLAGVSVGGSPAAWWGTAALLTTIFVAWITLVNVMYLLTQIVIAADDCGVMTAVRRVAAFLHADLRGVAAVVGVVLAVAMLATGVSILAMAAFGLIAFVPFFGLAVVPLQLAAWLFRGVVFQFIGLTSAGAYLRLYRTTDSRPTVS